MNRIILSGYLTRAPELNSYGNALVAKTAIAVSRPQKKNETDFFNVTAFNKIAEFMEKYFDKGSRVFISGHLQTSTYEDKNGNKKTGYEVIVESVEFGDSKKKEPPGEGKPEEIEDSDLPF